jgi:hypothetical protein
VHTHSLSATKCNGLPGTITGAPFTANKNKVTRVPVNLQLVNGSKRNNLTIVASFGSRILQAIL